MAELTQQMVHEVERELIERGLIIEAGFAGYKLMFPHAMRNFPVYAEMERRAFFAGAQSLFAAIMNSGLDEGSEPTDADLRRMGNIADELKRFESVLKEAAREMGN